MMQTSLLVEAQASDDDAEIGKTKTKSCVVKGVVRGKEGTRRMLISGRKTKSKSSRGGKAVQRQGRRGRRCRDRGGQDQVQVRVVASSSNGKADEDDAATEEGKTKSKSSAMEGRSNEREKMMPSRTRKQAP